MNELVKQKVYIHNIVVSILRYGKGETDTKQLFEDIPQKISIPKMLYKYRSFSNDYAIESLRKNEIYFFSVDKLDDRFEGRINSDLRSFFVDRIFKDVSDKGIEEYIDMCVEFFERTPSITGVCSLSATSNSQIMWNSYADNNRGFCIEYDIESCKDEFGIILLPVMYSNDRQINAAKYFVQFRMGENYTHLSNEEFMLHEIYEILCTKNEEWKYQEEWRLIGYPNKCTQGPNIKSVFVGNAATAENVNIIKTIAKENGFDVYRQVFSFDNMQITYEPIYLD